MTRLLLVALASLFAGLLWVPRPTPAVRVPAPDEPLPAGCLARFGETRLRHARPIRSLALSPDGTRLAVTLAGEPVVHFWDVATAQPLRPLQPDLEKNPRSVVPRRRVMADGIAFAWSDVEKAVVAIDPATLRPVRGCVFRGGTRDEPFAASANGRVLALAVGRSVRLFDTTTGASLHPDLDRYPTDPAERLQVSADGRRLLTGAGRSVRTWDLPAGRLLAEFDMGRVGRPWLSPDGRLVVDDSTRTGCLQVHDATTGAEVFREPVDGNGQPWIRSMIGFAGNDRVWVHELITGRFATLELLSGRLGPVIDSPARPTFAVASPDGRHVAASGTVALMRHTDDRAARWVELESNRERQVPSCGSSPPACAIPVQFSPDGRQLLTWDGGHVLWDAAERSIRLSTENSPEWWWREASFSPDGRRIATVGMSPDGPAFVRVWEVASAAELFRFAPPGGASGCVFTPDGKRLVVAHPDTTFSVWDYATLEARAETPASNRGVWDRLGSPNAAVGQAAVRELTADAGAALALIREQSRPADAARLAALVADLDAPRFDVRESASKALAALGDAAEPDLRHATRAATSAEVRQRAEAILRRLEPIGGRVPVQRIRTARAAEVLERIGTADAIAILREWAASDRSNRRREAEAALARLSSASDKNKPHDERR